MYILNWLNDIQALFNWQAGTTTAIQGWVIVSVPMVIVGAIIVAFLIGRKVGN